MADRIDRAGTASRNFYWRMVLGSYLVGYLSQMVGHVVAGYVLHSDPVWYLAMFNPGLSYTDSLWRQWSNLGVVAARFAFSLVVFLLFLSWITPSEERVELLEGGVADDD